MADRGVLLMAYGTPATPSDVEAYYTHVRRGRPPTEEQLADLRRRYDAIGGTSPLLARTRAQADGLQAALGDGWRVELGMKHAAPFIEDGVTALAAAGVEEGVALVLAPHYSALSVGEYMSRATAGAVALTPVESWHLEPVLIELLAERVAAARATVDPGALVLFTAHSLPSRILESGDPYPTQLEETAAAVAAAAVATDWQVAWQSAGRTPEPWLGPDILEVIKGLDRDVVICPCGFVSDHLEVLYDVDIEAQRVAAEVGIHLARTASLNDDPRFLAMLAGVVRRAAA
jgi:protoporphyrin/coproporphyrin ferrochelatase